MSDFLFSTRRRAEGELRAALLRYLAPVAATCDERHGDWGSLAVLRGAHDAPDVLVERDGRISVLVGEPVVRVAPHAPALARVAPRRDAVHDLDAGWGGALDGGFALFAVDTASGAGACVADCASFVPLFTAEEGGALVVGTHVDAVAAAAGRSAALDPVSAADLLVNLTCTFPHTLYDGVRQFPPASSRRFGSGGWSAPAEAYWRPAESPPFASRRAAAGALRAAFREAVAAACAGHAEVGLLISGGEDARAVLGAVPEGVAVRAFVYADWENREVRVARAAARAYGTEAAFGRRGPDHYVEGMEAVASMVGSGQCFMDAHGWGIASRLGIDRLPVVLGGLSSDSFLKAEHAPARPDAPFAMAAASAIRPELLAAVRERREGFRRWLSEVRPATAAEWERLWPFSMRKHAANLHGNRRMFAAHEPYHARAVVEVAARVPVEWKRRRALFHAAMRPFLRPSWHVPHARWRFPYFGFWANLPLTVGLRVARGARAVATGELRARQGPWPKWWRVAHSEAAEAKRRRYDPWTGPLAGVFADLPPEELARSVRAEWPALREMMLLQLAYLSRKATEDGVP